MVCRYRVPEVIESDRGTHFTGEVLQEIMMALRITESYHLQSIGKVERLNGTLKLKIQKSRAETEKPWTACLPIILYTVRTTPGMRTALIRYHKMVLQRQGCTSLNSCRPYIVTSIDKYTLSF